MFPSDESFGPYRSRHYRWFYLGRNVMVATTLPLLVALGVGVSVSSYGTVQARLVTAAAIVAAVGIGLTGVFGNVLLRRRADRVARSALRPVIFRSALLSSSTQEPTPTGAGRVVLSRGWVEVRGQSLALVAGDGEATETLAIPLDDVIGVERRVVAAGAGYPHLVIRTPRETLDLEVPPQSGLTLQGITDRELGGLIDTLRGVIRAAS